MTIIALNNKSNLSKEEFKEYISNLNNINTNNPVILCPIYLNIPLFSSNKIFLGAQNVSKTNNGAYTGEVSASQLKSFNVKYCIVGHSERRQLLKETNEDISEKIKRLVSNDIVPILCIGETQEEYNNHKTKEVILSELKESLGDLNDEEIKKIIIAYEPIWSIGTGLIPTIEEIDSVLEYIKTLLPYNKVLYGGSANDENIDILKTSKYIDGYLLGGLSLKVDKLQLFLNKLSN